MVKIEFRGRWASGIHPLNDLGPSCAVFVTLQITVDGSYHRPSVLDVDTQHRIKELPTQNRIEILLDVHGQGVPTITGQAAGPHHAPQSFFLHQQASLLGQGASDTVVLMSGVYHDVRTVKRRPFGIVIEERTTRGKNIPGVIKVKIQHAQPKSKMNTGHGIAAIDCSEWPCGKTCR